MHVWKNIYIFKWLIKTIHWLIVEGFWHAKLPHTDVKDNGILIADRGDSSLFKYFSTFFPHAN